MTKYILFEVPRICRCCGDSYDYSPRLDPPEANCYCSAACHNEAVEQAHEGEEGR